MTPRARRERQRARAGEWYDDARYDEAHGRADEHASTPPHLPVAFFGSRLPASRYAGLASRLDVSLSNTNVLRLLDTSCQHTAAPRWRPEAGPADFRLACSEALVIATFCHRAAPLRLRASPMKHGARICGIIYWTIDL